MQWYWPEDERVEGTPRQAMIELTNRCQLACVTCPRDKVFAADYEIGTMSFDQFRHIFGQWEEGLDVLDLTGLGESLMHPRIFEIIRYIRSRRALHLYLTTNTILLTPARLRRLREDPVDTLCVSVDGTTQEEYSAVRGPLHFGKLRTRVERAVCELGACTEFILCVVLMHETVPSMPRFVELAAELGIGRVSLKPINLVGNATPSAYYRRFLGAEFTELAAQATELGAEAGVEVDVFRIGEYQCTFPWEPIYVTWDGYVVPCCAKPFPKRKNFGNLLRQSWAEIRNAPEFTAFRRALLSEGDAPAFCDKCHIMEKTMFRDRGLPVLNPASTAQGS